MVRIALNFLSKLEFVNHLYHKICSKAHNTAFFSNSRLPKVKFGGSVPVVVVLPIPILWRIRGIVVSHMYTDEQFFGFGFCVFIASFLISASLLLTALAREVMQSPHSVCLSICFRSNI